MITELLTRLRFLARRKPAADLDAELRAHIDHATDRNLALGMSPGEARRRALIEFGSMESTREQSHRQRPGATLDTFWQDLRYTIRTLRRDTTFTVIAILSLALGIGANTAIFTLIRQVVLQELPVRDPQQLVTFGKSTGGGVLGGVDMGTADLFTYDFAQQLEAKPGPFEGVAAYSSFPPKVNVRVPNAARAIQVPVTLVSRNFFHVLGAEPLLGRTIAPFDEDVPHRSAVAVVSYHFWQHSLSSDPGILGKTILINATTFTVIGVMPEAFHGLKLDVEPVDMWVPIPMVEEVMLQPDMLQPRALDFLQIFARRNPHTLLAADQSWLDRQIRNYVRLGEGAAIAADRQREIERITVPLIPAPSGVSGLRNQYGDSLKILTVIVALVLLIACANLANFLLARAVARQREVATRLALGSSRARIVWQSVAEAILLSLSGGLLGLAVAFAVARALILFVAHGVDYSALSARPNGPVLAFTLGVSVLAGLLFGLAPALQVSRSAAGGPALNASTRTAPGSGDQRSRLWPKALVTAQITLCLLLLIGAGLFLRTLRNLQVQDFGFERTQLVIAQINAELAGYKPEQAPALNQRLLERLPATPGVRSAALSDAPPISYRSWTSTLSLTGYTPAAKENMASVFNRVSGRYFETAGVSIVSGRAITPADTATSMKVAVVNETIARSFFPKGDAIGRTLKVDIDTVEGPWQIVGIARDTRSGGLRDEPQRMVYLPLMQITGKHGEGIRDSFASTILLRTAGDPQVAVRDLRSAVADIDPNLPILQVRTMQEHLGSFMSRETLISQLTSIFAGLAVLLAAIGLYGVISFNVIRRTGEIGVRIALGASGPGVQWMVLRESFALLAIGLGLGLPIALYAVRFVRSQLYRMSPFDPAIFVAATAVISLVAVLAAWLPARRAAAVDPMTALRCE